MTIERDPNFILDGGLVTHALRQCSNLEAAQKIAEGLTQPQLTAIKNGRMVVRGDNLSGYRLETESNWERHAERQREAAARWSRGEAHPCDSCGTLVTVGEECGDDDHYLCPDCFTEDL